MLQLDALSQRTPDASVGFLLSREQVHGSPEAAQTSQVTSGFPKESLQGNRGHTPVPSWSFTVRHSFLWLRSTMLKVNIHQKECVAWY